MYDVYKMKMSLRDIQSLIQEVENKLFIPKKFRKSPFTDRLRNDYVTYLKREAGALEKRIGFAESGGKISPKH